MDGSDGRRCVTQRDYLLARRVSRRRPEIVLAFFDHATYGQPRTISTTHVVIIETDY